MPRRPGARWPIARARRVPRSAGPSTSTSRACGSGSPTATRPTAGTAGTRRRRGQPAARPGADDGSYGHTDDPEADGRRPDARRFRALTGGGPNAPAASDVDRLVALTHQRLRTLTGGGSNAPGAPEASRRLPSQRLRLTLGVMGGLAERPSLAWPDQ